MKKPRKISDNITGLSDKFCEKSVHQLQIAITTELLIRFGRATYKIKALNELYNCIVESLFKVVYIGNFVFLLLFKSGVGFSWFLEVFNVVYSFIIIIAVDLCLVWICLRSGSINPSFYFCKFLIADFCSFCCLFDDTVIDSRLYVSLALF